MRVFVCLLYNVFVKKNLFELFMGKLLAYPLWVKQAVYYRLYLNMQENYCERFVVKNAENLFAFYNPTVTFKGNTELWDRKSGLDTNIYNFLRLSSEGYSILEISLNTFLSMEEAAKNFMFCLEQNFIEKPESDEVYAMGGFIAGKFRTGEYYKINGSITIDQLDEAIMTQRRLDDRMEHKLFGKILVDLGFITEKNVQTLFTLKADAKQRFILDSSIVPESETSNSEKEKLEAKIELLEKSNDALKRKMNQLLHLVRQDDDDE